MTFVSTQVRMTFIIAVCCCIAMIFGYFQIASTSAPLRTGADVIPYEAFVVRKDHFIPKILWRTSKFELHEAPEAIHTSLSSAAKMNPDYTQVYVSDSNILTFISAEFPQYLRQYNSLLPGAYKADLFRLLILYKYGGVYNDIGHEYVVPLSEIISYGDEFVAATEDNKMKSFQHALHNSFIATYPNNPLVWAMIECVVEDVGTCKYNSDPLDVTGPAALGHAFNAWKANQRCGRHASFAGYDDKMPRGRTTVHGMQMTTLSHDSQNRRLIYNGKTVINTKFKDYYKLLYNTDKDKSTYDKMWKARQIYDVSQTNCEPTDTLVKREAQPLR